MRRIENDYLVHEDCRMSSFDRRRCIAVLGTTLLLLPVLAAAETRVAVLIGDHGPYRAAAKSLLDTLRGRVDSLTPIDFPDDEAGQTRALRQLKSEQFDVIATTGSRATLAAAGAVANTPIIAFMVVNALDATWYDNSAEDGNRIACVSADVSPRTQIRWIRKSAPDVRRIAVLCSERTRVTAAALSKAAASQKLDLIKIESTRAEFAVAIDRLRTESIDGVLMVPDAQVYNAPNVQRLLLWGARQKRPVWAFSTKVVHAGAFSGLATEPEAVGKQAADVVVRVTRGAHPGTIGIMHAERVVRFVNTHTASMIDISLDPRVFDSTVKRLGEQP